MTYNNSIYFVLRPVDLIIIQHNTCVTNLLRNISLDMVSIESMVIISCIKNEFSGLLVCIYYNGKYFYGFDTPNVAFYKFLLNDCMHNSANHSDT